jgi:hypothetical protein
MKIPLDKVLMNAFFLAENVIKIECDVATECGYSWTSAHDSLPNIETKMLLHNSLTDA